MGSSLLEKAVLGQEQASTEVEGWHSWRPSVQDGGREVRNMRSDRSTSWRSWRTLALGCPLRQGVMHPSVLEHITEDHLVLDSHAGITNEHHNTQFMLCWGWTQELVPARILVLLYWMKEPQEDYGQIRIRFNQELKIITSASIEVTD